MQELPTAAKPSTLSSGNSLSTEGFCDKALLFEPIAVLVYLAR
jgi:hypothetical protein